MANVILKNVIKRFGKAQVLHGIDLEIADKEFVVLVGPSGCGKSTVLRMIAGLEEVSDGEVWIGDRLVNNVAPKDRKAAMVFQNYALYPHMNVYNNMAFGLKLAKRSKQEIQERVQTAAAMLELQDLLKRKPHQLSGGQRQRVAMGRAIVRNPSVFLFDEPLSNLDAKLRTQMRIEIKRLHRKVATTVIYVTHDQVEAMTLADRIVVMRGGRIEQIGKPIEIFQNPANTFVAGFIGSPPMNLIDAVIQVRNGTPHLHFNDRLRLPVPPKRGAHFKDGAQVIMGLRTEDIFPADVGQTSPDHWVVDGVVEVVEPLGSETNIHMDLKGIRVVAKCDGRRPLKTGETIPMALDFAHLHIFDAETTRSIY